jgi:hypothetical protein
MKLYEWLFQLLFKDEIEGTRMMGERLKNE